MAGEMIFHIKFDLDSAVKGASDSWEKKYADQLEKALAKRKIKVNLSFGSLDKLDDIEKRLKALKIEPLTPENRKAIQDLTRELTKLAQIMEKLSSLRGITLPELQRAQAAKLAKEAAQADEKLALQKERLRQAEEKLILAQQRAARQATETGRAFGRQSTYLERLINRMVAVYSIKQVGTFLNQIREVTAQFELQRISLGAIIQDQNRANMLFSEIKQFALQSPISIMDLTKYTKQVAAYRIETDKLFDTTKRLADVSVGLGVDMGRLVLAYGQVKAASYLRAAEIRQFTEAGIPMLELLAEKFTQLEGRAVSTEQVMDKVSKRMVSFGMVEEIFKDMTSAGGMFYQMQEKQSETLFGLWAKLGDAASVMYDQIGNTDSVNRGMKSTISLLETLMRNWEATAATIATMGGLGGAVFLTGMAKKRGVAIQDAALAKERQAKAELLIADKKLTIAEKELAAAMAKGDAAATAEAQATRDAAAATQAKAAADYKAAQAANANTQSQNKLALGFKSLGLSLAKGLSIGIVITLVTTLIYKLYEAWTASGRLRDALDEISAKAERTSGASVQNFRSLANAALAAVDGSRQQNEALDELRRTYGNMIPLQDLTIEKLRALNGEYTSLTDAIKEYIAQQTLSEKMSTIYEEYGKGVENARKQLLKFIQSGIKVNGRNIGEDQARRIIANFRKGVEEEGKSIKDAIRDAFKVESIVFSDQQIEQFAKASHELGNYGKQLKLMVKEINDVKNEAKDSLGSLGRYADAWNNTTKAMEDFTSTTKKGSFLYSREKLNSDVIWLKQFIKDVFAKEGIEWDDTVFGDFVEDVGEKGEKVSVLFWDKINNAAKKGSSQLRKALEKAKTTYDNLIPSDAVVTSVREKYMEIANSMDLMEEVRVNMMGASEDLEEYRKKINDTAKDYAQQVQNLTKVLAATPVVSLAYQEIAEELAQTEKLKTFYELMAEILGKTKSGRSQADPRLGILQEMVSSLKSINKEYDELQKKEGAEKAYANTFRIYQNTFDKMQKLSDQYGFGLPQFDVPTTATELKRYLDMVRQVMEGLPKSDKAVLALQLDIDKIDIDDTQKQLDKKLKTLSDKIARSKTAKEFFDKIFEQTGDVDVATKVTFSLYGDTGEGLFEQMVDQIRKTFTSGDMGIDVEITTDIDAAIDTTNQRINYKMLGDIYEKYQNDIIEKNRDTAQKIISEGQKTAAANVLTWEKELAKAKDYEQQRTDIINRESQRRAEIYKSNLPQEEKDQKAAQSRVKQSKELAKVNFEEFTKSEDYIKIFENLENTSTTALKRLREEMQKVIDTNQGLSPENMKTLVKAMEDIDTQISGRGFGNDMVQSVRDYIAALRDLKTARTELQASQAEYDAQLPQLDAAIEAAKNKEIAAQKALNTLKAQEFQDANAIVAAELQLNNATKAVTNAEQAKAKAAEKVKKAETKVTNQQDKQKKATNKFFNDLQKVAQTADQLASVLGDIEETLGVSADSAAGVAFDSAIEGLNEFSKILNVVIGLQTLYNIVTSSNPWLAIAAAVLAVGQMLGSFIANNKVRKANKEIERQQDLIDQLEYSYGRLENAIEDTFGTAYLRLYRQQLANLQAQQNAYLKQAEAERSKGKKADKDKIKDYENSARDAADAIADMQGTLAEKFLGSDLASTARDFAKAWLDAYKEFGNTADAMSEKFHEMIQNMIVESLLGSVMEKALKPAFDMIDNMKDTDFMNQDFWKSLTDTAAKAVQNADAGAYTMMSFLEQAGITMRDLGGDLTGISRDVASASEESINGLAAGINTQNFYISQQLAEVRLIREAVVGRGDSGAMFTDLMAMQNEHLSHLPVIAANTAATVERCERAALACEDMASQLRKVIRPKQETNATYAVTTKLLQ